jgi:hypothetical protein
MEQDIRLGAGISPGLGGAKRDRRTALWLTGTLVLAIVMLVGVAATSGSRLMGVWYPDPKSPAPASDLASVVLSAPRGAPGSSLRQPEALPGFQRRGNSLVGEFTTRDGQLIRLVIDGRTHTIVGARVVQDAGSTASR